MSSTSTSSEFPFVPIRQLTSYAVSYAAAHGIQVEIKRDSTSVSTTTSNVSYQCAPISLLPNAFPKSAFTAAIDLAPAYNLLVDRISRDVDFLEQTLAGKSFSTSSSPTMNNEHETASVIASDLYTRKLLELYRSIYCSKSKDGDAKVNFAMVADRLGIHRSDYMLNPAKQTTVDQNSDNLGYELKQVELNTIAASFAGLSVQVAKMHRLLTQRFHKEIHEWMVSNQEIVLKSKSGHLHDKVQDMEAGVPDNPAMVCLPHAIDIAHRRYVNRFLSKTDTVDPSVQPIVLFIVQDSETNTVDQRMLEFNLFEKHSISVIRMSLTRAYSQLHLDEETGALFVSSDDHLHDGNINHGTNMYEVSIVYFRAGYAPTDYPDGYDGKEWQAREQIERSRATKCPCLGYHLAGTKKVQQSVARPGVLERFFDMDNLSERSMVLKMRRSFAELFSLGQDAIKEDINAVRNIIINSQEGQYVLKPQREGGGYNFYGESLAQKLATSVDICSDDDTKVTLHESLAEFILMERLFPPKQHAILLRGGVVEGMGATVSELGCFGAIIASDKGTEIVHNEYSGFLLRTKFSGVDEGGVASGFATLSSPYLC